MTQGGRGRTLEALPAPVAGHFLAAHPHPPPQRQLRWHPQRSPQVQRSAGAPAQPQDVSAQRHGVAVLSSF